MADPKTTPGLPVPISPPEPSAKAEAPRRGPFATFAAQLLGGGVRGRGLKGGPPVIEAARAAYLETEYSGPNDRRPPKGIITRKDV